jgi:hypothetical protein
MKVSGCKSKIEAGKVDSVFKGITFLRNTAVLMGLLPVVGGRIFGALLCWVMAHGSCVVIEM